MEIETGEGQLQIHLVTKQLQYAVADVPYSIGASVSQEELNTFVNALLQENDDAKSPKPIDFEFIILNEFLRDMSNINVIVGTNNWASGGTRYKIEKHIGHEQHNKPEFAYDFGLIKVTKDIEFNEKVQPIEYTNEKFEEGSARLTGWGRLSAGGPRPQMLQTINLTVISTEKCRVLMAHNAKHVHDSHMCTFEKKGQGACRGDTGGPLVLGNKLIGVVNFAVPCALGYPDGYAKISYFYDWIQKHLD